MSEQPDGTEPLDYLAQAEQWVEAAYARLKEEQDARSGAQLELGIVEGVNLVTVRDYLLRLNAIEEVLELVGTQRTALYQTMRDEGLPFRTIKLALKIARGKQKMDSTEAMLEACIAVAESLMPAEGARGD